MSANSGIDLSKTFRILIASDIHLGYNERHHERGKDSFVAFEEVLTLARDEDVDLILLGGDLFHLNKPSFRTLQKTIELLRQYCLGCRPIQWDIVSNQSDNFSHYPNFKHANHLDDNLNVSMPVFTIHGNHDDPTGADNISVLDSLSSAGLVNYFGKYTNMDEITLSPILLQKGNCKIALFGLGSINEERLFRIVSNGKLNYQMPDEEEDEWYKIVVVHQNRIKHPNTKYLPEKFLSSLPNLVIWGHEHEASVEPDYNASEQFFIYQPGSTVATSLCEAESVPKRCGILEVFFDEINSVPKFRIETRLLKTVRPFIWETVDIPDLISQRLLRSDEDSVREYCKTKVQQMIQTASLQLSGDERQPKMPLIRLRLEFSDESQQFHSAQFGSQFNGRVANHSEIITYVKRKENRNYEDIDDMHFMEMMTILDQDVIGQRVNITDIIKEYFEKIKDTKLKMDLLSENALTLAVIELVEKESNEAINDVFEAQKSSMKECLLALDDLKVGDFQEIRGQIRRIKDQNKTDNESIDLNRILAESRNRMSNRVKPEVNDNNDNSDNNDSDSDFGHMMVDAIESTREQNTNTGRDRGRGRGRGRGRTATIKKEPEAKPRKSSQTTLNWMVEPSTSGNRRTPRSAAKKPKYEEIDDEVIEISESD